MEVFQTSTTWLSLKRYLLLVSFCAFSNLFFIPTVVHGQQGGQLSQRNYQQVETIIPAEHLPRNVSPIISTENPESLPLKRPGGLTKVGETSTSSVKPAAANSILPAMACCLAILMVFWLVTLSYKQKSPQYAPSIPNEALEFLGRKSIDLKSSIYYLRCGGRILIVGHSEAGLQTLGEVTDPLEVDIISGMCRAEKSRESLISESFKTLFLRTQPQESAPQPTSSLKNRLHKVASQVNSPPVLHDGRKIG